MKTVRCFLGMLFIISVPLHSQPARKIPPEMFSDAVLKGTLNLDPQGNKPASACSTRLDSIKKTLPDHQSQIHSKKIILTTGDIIIDITQSWNDSVWVNSEMDSTLTNSRGEIIEYVKKSWWNNTWMNYTRTVSTYDANGHQMTFLYQTGDGASWLNNYQQFFTYDGDGHETSFFLQNWIGGAWVNSYQDIYEYNADGYSTSFVCQGWLGGTWTNSYRYIYAPDAIGRDTNTLYQTWNDTVWVNATLEILTFDAHGNETSDLTKGWSGSSWTNSALASFTYDAGGHLTKKLNQVWTLGVLTNYQQFLLKYDAGGNDTSDMYQQWKDNSWLNQWLWNYTYDGQNHQTSALKQNWKVSEWVPDYRYLYSYDVNGRETGYILQEGYTGMLENALQHLYSYDADGNCIDDLCQGWNNPNWVNANHTSYTYDINGNLTGDVYQMWQGGGWANNTRDILTFMFSGSMTTTSVSVNDGWNLVSVPMVLNDYSKSTLFPTATSPAFGYQGSYVTLPSLKNGTGYWLKFTGAQSIPLTGYLNTLDTIKVTAGWNLIGSLSAPVSVTNVGSIPGGMITSDFFGYAISYYRADTILPGRGYWVKVNQKGKLVLSGFGNIPASAAVRIEPQDDMPPTPPAGDLNQGRRGLPLVYQLEQNYPNPFNPSTRIQYALPSGGHVRLSIFNVLGQEVMRVIDESQDAGYKSVAVNMNDLPSGLYVCRMSAGTFTDVKKMVLIK